MKRKIKKQNSIETIINYKLHSIAIYPVAHTQCAMALRASYQVVFEISLKDNSTILQQVVYDVLESYIKKKIDNTYIFSCTVIDFRIALQLLISKEKNEYKSLIDALKNIAYNLPQLEFNNLIKNGYLSENLFTDPLPIISLDEIIPNTINLLSYDIYDDFTLDDLKWLKISLYIPTSIISDCNPESLPIRSFILVGLSYANIKIVYPTTTMEMYYVYNISVWDYILLSSRILSACNYDQDLYNQFSEILEKANYNYKNLQTEIFKQLKIKNILEMDNEENTKATEFIDEEQISKQNQDLTKVKCKANVFGGFGDQKHQEIIG